MTMAIVEQNNIDSRKTARAVEVVEQMSSTAQSGLPTPEQSRHRLVEK